MDVKTLAFLAFFAAVAVVNYALPKVVRPYFLLIASYAFYCYDPANLQLVALLVGATLITWASGLAIGRLNAKPARLIFLMLSVFTCLGILFLYKYLGLFDRLYLDIVAALGGNASPLGFTLVPPLGLSYFTFTSLSYVFDVYQGKQEATLNPLKYALFVSFFPAIFTGPIEQYSHLAPQFDAMPSFDYSLCSGGAFRMLWGYFKKMVLADTIAPFVSVVFKAPGSAGGLMLLLACAALALQIYWDFSGCCDIAIGAARILGIELLENFNNPFAALSFGDFWRRWHITLTGWFRRYIYFPLGGSRKGTVRHLINLVLVFTVSGFWHGADWGYLGWGIYCGVVSAIAVQLTPLTKNLNANPIAAHAPWLWHGFQRLWVFLLFSFSFLFFGSAMAGKPIGEAVIALGGGWSYNPAPVVTSGIDPEHWLMLGLGLLLVLSVENRGNVAQWIRRRMFLWRWLLYYLLGLWILFYGAFGQSLFIYQQY